jgi:PPM family protein phosphatase
MAISDADPPAGGNRTKGTRRRAATSVPYSAPEFRPPSAVVRVDVAARSERGASRASNDDHYLAVRLERSQETIATSLSDIDIPEAFHEYGYAMLVADGIGEAGAGSVASRVALSTIAHLALDHGRWNLRINPDTVMDIMARAEQFYSRADAEVFARSRADTPLAGMSTSLTAAYSAGDSLFVAHVGHSRAYLFREGALTQLTRDQTMARHIASSKIPVAVERSAQDLQHILTDAIGAGPNAPVVEVEQFKLKHGDSVLLCTNGLTDVIDDVQIAEVLALPRQSAEQCALLIEMAQQQQTADNITVVLGQYRVPR